MRHQPYGRGHDGPYWRANQTRPDDPADWRGEEDRSFHRGGRYGSGYAMNRQEAERVSRNVGEGEWGWGARGHHDNHGLMDRARSFFGGEAHDRDDPRRDHRGQGPRGYRRTDSRIGEDVCDRLTEDRYLDARDVEVRVYERQVILSGTVTDGEDARRAERLAGECPGVALVRNELRIR